MLILKSVNFEQQQFENHHLKQSHPGQNEWSLGRNPACDLVLSSPEVSRMHGRIVRSGDTYYFMDLGSLSGSLLNGKSVAVNDKCQLRTGDLLQLGETFLYVEELGVPESAASIAYPTLANSEAQWTSEDLQCRCCRIVDETPDVKTFYFLAEPPVLFDYKPGQFVNIEIEIDGKPVIRSYSISSSPTRPYHLSLTIKRVPAPSNQPELPAGLVSNWMHDHLKVGDYVKFIGGPLGHFTCLPDLSPKLLLISAGSGITPMMSMTRWVQDALADCDIVFLHSARTSDDIVFRAELEAIAAQMPNFHLAVTLTQQPMGRPWMGLTGRISESMLQMVAPDLHKRAVYVCGPEGFMQGVRSLMESLQFPMQNYKEESFGGKKAVPAKAKSVPTTTPGTASPMIVHTIAQPEPMLAVASSNGRGHYPDTLPPKPASTTSATPEIAFLKSERSVSTDGSESLLEIAEQEGVSIRNACRVGACGACKVRVRKGQVRYDSQPAALSSADQEAGYALACVAYPVNQVAIDA